MIRISTVSAAACLCLAAFATSAQAEWITTWTAAPVPPSAAQGNRPATPSFENRTLRQILRVSAGGESVRVRLTNAFGSNPIEIGAARIALLDDQDRPAT